MHERVLGTDLRTHLAERGPLPAAQAVNVAVAVCDALEPIHAAGSSHRGLTLRDVVLGGAGGPDAGRVKVADVILAGPWSGVDAVPALPPGVLPGPAGDIHRLGALLYELVTGRAVPRPGTTPIVPPRQVRAGIPRPVEEVILRALSPDAATRPATAGDLRRALLEIDLGEDDAVPLLDAAPTPPSGVQPSFRETERRWLATAVVLLVAAAALVVLAVRFSQTDVGRGLLDKRPSETPPAAAPARIVAVRSFDPERDKTENEDETAAAVDGDPATAWSTDRYRTRAFGGLKTGVGLIVDLDEVRAVRSVEVRSRSKGWSADIYVAPGVSDDLDGWGEPVGSIRDSAGDVTADTGGASGGVVLLWITDLGPGTKVEVGEITVR